MRSIRLINFAVIFLFALHGAARAQVAPAINQVREPATVKVGRYLLQSNRWVNLHQRLLYDARFKGATPENLSAADGVKWNRAVEVYRSYFGKRSPIVDKELIRLDADLSLVKGNDLPKSIPETLLNALNLIMPVYQSSPWEGDDRVNRFWISIAVPLLTSAGEELIRANEKAYGVPFPKQIRVDVCMFAWEFGAYTVPVGDSAHVVISSTDPANLGFRALEALMHEPSHVIVDSNTGAIGGDLSRISSELGVKARYNLWHAILFYTAGELTRRALAERGVPDYQRVIDAGMYERGFQGFQKPLETHWQSYLDGKMSREDALRQILIETTQTKK